MCGKSPLGGELAMSLLGPGSTLSDEMIWRRCDFEKRNIDAFNELCVRGLVFDPGCVRLALRGFA